VITIHIADGNIPFDGCVTYRDVTAIIIVIVIVTSSDIPDRHLTADRGVRDTRAFTDRDILDTPFVDKDRITTDSHVSRSIVYIVNSNVT
jgi:hypothetical protein